MGRIIGMWQIGSGLGRGGTGGGPRLEWKVSEPSREDDMNVVLDYEWGGYMRMGIKENRG